MTLPLLVVFVVGIFDFSSAFTLKQKLTNVARDAARAAAADPANDLQSSSPMSVNDAFQVVDSYLLANNLNDCGITLSSSPVEPYVDVHRHRKRLSHRRPQTDHQSGILFSRDRSRAAINELHLSIRRGPDGDYRHLRQHPVRLRVALWPRCQPPGPHRCATQHDFDCSRGHERELKDGELRDGE